MLAKKNSSKNGESSYCSMSCYIGHVVVVILLLIATVVAAADMVLAHVLQGGLVFGTAGASLSVIAFVAALTVFFKKVKKMCCGCCGGGSCCR